MDGVAACAATARFVGHGKTCILSFTRFNKQTNRPTARRARGMTMSDLLKNIDARTKLAGTNKLEILLFFLGVDHRTGRRETYGINVFKVREVMRTPVITAAPDMPASVEGMVSLRGALVPVIDLAKYSGLSAETPREIMIVTEYNGHTQGFLVEGVDTILRSD
jgi:two-component system chemotaxis response regulator CheV